MFRKDNSHTTGLVFRDIVFLALFAILLALIYILPHVNPVGDDERFDLEQPGQMMIELIWPPDNPVDVDLLVKDPYGEVVFFRNQTTSVFSLVRDDRGTLNDHTGLNFEHVFSRMLPDGVYTVNAIAYALGTGKLPVDVHVNVSLRDFDSFSNRSETVIQHSDVIRNLREEITLVRFIVVDGKILNGSISHYNESIMPVLEFTTEEETSR